MEISQLEAWYSDKDGSLMSPATYIVKGLCRRCCLPEVILRCMQVSPQMALTSISIALQSTAFITAIFSHSQVSVTLAGSGVPPDCHDKLIELVGSPETHFLDLFSQQQLQACQQSCSQRNILSALLEFNLLFLDLSLALYISYSINNLVYESSVVLLQSGITALVITHPINPRSHTSRC